MDQLENSNKKNDRSINLEQKNNNLRENIDSNNPNFVGKYYELDKGYGYNYYVCK